MLKDIVPQRDCACQTWPLLGKTLPRTHLCRRSATRSNAPTQGPGGRGSVIERFDRAHHAPSDPSRELAPRLLVGSHAGRLNARPLAGMTIGLSAETHAAQIPKRRPRRCRQQSTPHNAMRLRWTSPPHRQRQGGTADLQSRQHPQLTQAQSALCGRQGPRRVVAWTG